MQRLTIRRASGLPSADKSKCEGLLTALADRWPAVVRAIRNAQSEVFSIPQFGFDWGSSPSFAMGKSELPVLGEVFAIPGGILIAQVREMRSGGRVRFRQDANGQIFAIDNEGEGSGKLRITFAAFTNTDATEVLDDVSTQVREALGVDLEPFHYGDERFERLKSDLVAEELPSSDVHIRAARVLVDRGARTLAQAIKSSRGMLERDIQRQASEGKTSTDPLDRLVAAGVITREAVVVCGSSGAQIVRLPDKTGLSKLARAGVRCACGEPINRESPEYLYSATDVGTLLLDKSRWMSILVKDRLVNLGVADENILLECRLGGDEIDCLALVSGEVMLLELKDKTFSMGHAYSFGAKISIVKPRHSVVVTTESVEASVKDHFSRTSAGPDPRVLFGEERESQPVRYIEGADFLTSLDPILAEVYEADARRLVDSVLPLGLARASSLVDALRDHTSFPAQESRLPRPSRPAKTLHPSSASAS